MTPGQLNILAEIRALLKEAYDDYFKRGDGYCKSSEGYVEVRYPNYFDTKHFADAEASGIGIYSYALGPNRMHNFDSFERALEAVKQWHKEEMERPDDDF